MENFEKQFNQPKPPEEAKNPELKQETPPVSESPQSPPENLNKSAESTTENQEKVESVKSQKEIGWENKQKEIEGWGDKQGLGIDEKVKDTVVAFNALGLPTGESCEGHLKHGYSAPWVGVEAPDEPAERFIGQEKSFLKFADEYGLSLEEIKRGENNEAYFKALGEAAENGETPEFEQWRQKNQELMKKSSEFLDEFYKKRKVPENIKLEISEGAEGAFRIHNGGEDYGPMTDEKFEKLTEEQKKELSQRLEQYQSEMKEFTEFLKGKYFEGNSDQHNPETKTEKKKTGSGLYDVKEVEGGFEVVFPGLFDKKREVIVGTSKQHFETREEAEQAAELAKEDIKIQFERASLEKTFTKYFYRIDEAPDGKFHVILPGLLDSKTGYYVGTTRKEFGSWNEAKEFYLSQRESEERLTQKPLLEIKINGTEKIAFSDIESFSPHLSPSKKSHEIPSSIEEYLLNKEKLVAEKVSTYQETLKEKDWETKLFSFVSSYLKKEGAGIAKELKIENLDALTPKQAIELATQTVVDLTKYKESDTAEERKKRGEDVSKKTQSDQSTVLQLLREGLNRRNDSEWEGNGVCRNFASSVKAVFEALKANQTKFNQLRDTYCLYESGAETFAPKRDKKSVTELSKTGHAWNTFVSVSREGAANAVIIDTTWAKRNLETKKVEGLDYTLTRMEPVVHAIGEKLQETTPDKEEQLKHILSFYMLKMEKQGDTGGFVSPEEEKQFYATRALELMTKQGVPNELPKPLAEAIGQQYLEIAGEADKTEIETIYKISQGNPDLDFRSIFKNYLKDKQLSDYQADSLIFQDNNLQRAVFEEIKLQKDFDSLIKESSKFRVRMRESLPQLFIGFSPGTKQEDRKELLHLMESSNSLRYEKNRIGKTEEELKNFFMKKRESLRAINPQKYNENIAGLDDYQLVKQFDRIERELRT